GPARPRPKVPSARTRHHRYQDHIRRVGAKLSVMDDDETRDAFGYRPPARRYLPIGVRVAEGKNSETLQPEVVIVFRFEAGDSLPLDADHQVLIAVTPDIADGLAAELTRWAVR